MPKLVTEKFGDEDYQYFPIGKHIVSAPEICDGRPTFKCTRIEVAGILAMLADGDTVDEIIEDYNGRISHEAILEAIQIRPCALLKDHAQEQVVAINRRMMVSKEAV